MDEIIDSHVDKKCVISHDNWSSYRSLRDKGYEDHVVNHSEHFVSPEGFHTNKIEGLWGLIKQHIRAKKGIPEHQITYMLNEFMFRHNNYSQYVIPETLLYVIIAE